MTQIRKNHLDRTNAAIAAAIFVIAFILYALTVQRSFSFWDCGEFVACSYILGIPHPPGFPLFIILGRIFAIIPFVEDISYRINYLSVISSAFTAMFSYLLTVKLIRYFFKRGEDNRLARLITYIGGIAGGLFVAFSQTNWANSVETEVYGLGIALSVMIVWMTIKYFEQRGTVSATKILILAFYLALLGVGVHMTVFLVVPSCAIFFVLKKDASVRDWLTVCSFIIAELALIIIFSNGRGGLVLFYLFTAVFGVAVIVLLYSKINWAILIAIVSASSVMLAFSKYIIITPVALVALIVLGFLSEKKGWGLQWKPGIALVLVAFVGMSVHLFVPIRSSLNPRIDENNPSRDWRTFVNFLDRKQYGQISMVERMFERRGLWSNQFGRHPHMGFWSYFEEQYSPGGWNFIFPFFILGLIGLITAIKKRLEIGLPYFTLFLMCSVGLVLYMNFADGTQFDLNTGDAYLEVRNRDYFFTPAFVFFGIAMGMGVSAVMMYIRDWAAKFGPKKQRLPVLASSVLVLLPLVALGSNYHTNDRSANNIPYIYAANILDTCEPNALLFTTGDNDTFPLWCIQEVYDYRKDVTVVNLSLLNTDWYVEQMKNRYGVPISLDDEQILWYPEEYAPGLTISKPRKPFHDRPRQRRTFLISQPSRDGTRIRVQDMMVDEIVLENKWRRPIYFSSMPYAESPLKLREHTSMVGMMFQLDREPNPVGVNIDRGYDLFMNKYDYDGYRDSKVFRDDNATGVFMALGIGVVRIYEELIRQGHVDSARALGQMLIDRYPEYWNTYILEVEQYERAGDTATGNRLLTQLHDTLEAFVRTNESNIYYLQDLGLVKAEMGRRSGNMTEVEEGLRIMYEAYNLHPNNGYGFRKLATVLVQEGRYQELNELARDFVQYRRNLQDPFVQRLLGISGQQVTPIPEPGG